MRVIKKCDLEELKLLLQAISNEEIQKNFPLNSLFNVKDVIKAILPDTGSA